MSETETCPNCEGAGEVAALLRYESGCRPGVVRCYTCGGMGFIDTTHAAAIRDGKRRSQERIAGGLSLREKAAQMGISPGELSRLEHANDWRPSYTLAEVEAARKHAGMRPLSVTEADDE